MTANIPATPTWGHYKNLHAKVFEATKKDCIQEFFAEPVCVTEKIDGSNLGCHVKRNEDGEWELLCLMGRNQPIWDTNNPRTLEQVPKYGNAGNLGKLPVHMKDFCVRVATTLKVDAIIVYGEAFRCGQEQQCASWHPFGYKTFNAANGDTEGDDTEGDDGFTLTRLTSQTHALFTQACQPHHPKPNNHAEVMQALKTLGAKEHLIFPPPVMFVGPLTAAVDCLHPVMLQQYDDATYEGTFVVFENGQLGFKWKTGTWDEQPAVPTRDELMEAIPTHCNAKKADVTQEIATYEKLLEVYRKSGKKATGPRFPKEKQAKFVNPADEYMFKDLAAAVEREMGKMAALEDVPKKDRKPFVAKLTPAVIDECLVQYKEAGVQPKYTEKDLAKHAPAVVFKAVMAVDFVDPTQQPVEAEANKQ